MESAACGFYGKVPIHADFVHGRLQRSTIEPWDAWMQEALAASQQALGETWREAFFGAPIWRFILPSGACGPHGLVGVMMPSVDAVGRCFPLMLGLELAPSFDPLAVMEGAAAWFAAAERLALRALGSEFSLRDLDRRLPSISSPGRYVQRAWPDTAGERAGLWYALPLASAAYRVVQTLVPAKGGRSAPPPALWWTTGSVGFAPGLALCHGLVVPVSFAAFVDGRWQPHGWRGHASAFHDAVDWLDERPSSASRARLS
ncbi:type VI secretion system protein ImpM [Arboricoccus pini]|uniref:Type VI secretion system protein ImpM n=1 Tax=Arboricoccus pini TaxID=1963835 RepID=A0A212RQM4_9PROT|nr:type VI secretion system-associated protein TagF [Arboricoccus pini]SNB74729.1 type VI secretion system protein ImpM [Arboricoccus pini]